jgi:autonomous glycyl radical cofactor GrcA
VGLDPIINKKETNMKKLSFLFLVLALALTACSSSEETGGEKEVKLKNGEAESVEVAFDKDFTAKTGIFQDKSTELRVTVSNYAVVQNQSTNAEDNEKHDFAQLDVAMENVGEKEASEVVVEIFSFKFYDENGQEIKVDTWKKDELKDVTFEPANLRPGGKNQGRLYFPIPKGSKPGEIVYKTNWMSILGSHEYVFKIK